MNLSFTDNGIRATVLFITKDEKQAFKEMMLRIKPKFDEAAPKIVEKAKALAPKSGDTRGATLSETIVAIPFKKSAVGYRIRAKTKSGKTRAYSAMLEFGPRPGGKKYPKKPFLYPALDAVMPEFMKSLEGCL